MATGTLIPVSEYLATTYHPDCDYVDGVVQERNLGEYDHGDVQGNIYTLFKNSGASGISASSPSFASRSAPADSAYPMYA